MILLHPCDHDAYKLQYTHWNDDLTCINKDNSRNFDSGGENCSDILDCDKDFYNKNCCGCQAEGGGFILDKDRDVQIQLTLSTHTVEKGSIIEIAQSDMAPKTSCPLQKVRALSHPYDPKLKIRAVDSTGYTGNFASGDGF